jgi:hypothetical protein
LTWQRSVQLDETRTWVGSGQLGVGTTTSFLAGLAWPLGAWGAPQNHSNHNHDPFGVGRGLLALTLLHSSLKETSEARLAPLPGPDSRTSSLPTPPPSSCPIQCSSSWLCGTRADAFDTMDITLGLRNPRAMRAWFMQARGCSRAKELLTTVTGPRPRTSHVASSTLEIRPPNGLRETLDWRCGRALSASRSKFIRTSSSLRGPTSSISRAALSCQHIDDLSSIALGLQICGHPPHPLSNSIKASGRTAYRFVGKQRHRVAVRDWKTRPFTRHVQGGGGGS